MWLQERAVCSSYQRVVRLYQLGFFMDQGETAYTEISKARVPWLYSIAMFQRLTQKSSIFPSVYTVYIFPPLYNTFIYSIHTYTFLSIYLYIYRYICSVPSIHPFIYLSLYKYIYVVYYLSIYISLYMYCSIHPSIYLSLYIQTRFQKSWDTVQIVNKNRMQWCGSFKFQYFIQNTT